MRFKTQAIAIEDQDLRSRVQNAVIQDHARDNADEQVLPPERVAKGVSLTLNVEKRGISPGCFTNPCEASHDSPSDFKDPSDNQEFIPNIKCLSLL